MSKCCAAGLMPGQDKWIPLCTSIKPSHFMRKLLILIPIFLGVLSCSLPIFAAPAASPGPGTGETPFLPSSTPETYPTSTVTATSQGGSSQDLQPVFTEKQIAEEHRDPWVTVDFVYPYLEGVPRNTIFNQGVEDFINALKGQTLSQADLDELLKKYGPHTYDAVKTSSFLNEALWAYPSTLRDINEFTVDAILDDDVEAFRKLKNEKKPTDGLILPVSKNEVTFNKSLGKCIAPGNKYNPDYGYLRKEVQIG